MQVLKERGMETGEISTRITCAIELQGVKIGKGNNREVIQRKIVIIIIPSSEMKTPNEMKTLQVRTGSQEVQNRTGMDSKICFLDMDVGET